MITKHSVRGLRIAHPEALPYQAADLVRAWNRPIPATVYAATEGFPGGLAAIIRMYHPRTWLQAISLGVRLMELVAIGRRYNYDCIDEPGYVRFSMLVVETQHAEIRFYYPIGQNQIWQAWHSISRLFPHTPADRVCARRFDNLMAQIDERCHFLRKQGCVIDRISIHTWSVFGDPVQVHVHHDGDQRLDFQENPA